MLARLAPRRRRARLHGATRRCLVDGIAAHVSRSGYTGEDGFEISVPAERRGRALETRCSPTRESSRSASAPATRCGSRPACPSTATTSTRPTSPVEAGLDLVDPEAPPRGGRLPRRRRASGASSPRDPARVRVGLRPEGAPGPRGRRRSSTPDGRVVGVVTSGGFGADAQRPRRHGLRAPGMCRSRARSSRSSCAARPCRAQSSPTALRPPPLQALTKARSDAMTTRYTKDHEYIRLEGDTGTVGITDYAQEPARRRRLRRAARGRQDGGEGRRGGRGRERQGRVRDLRAGLRRGRRGQQRPRRRPGAVNDDPAGRGWFVKITRRRPGRARRPHDRGAVPDFVKSIS